jgi:hypothetical protein
VDQRYHQQCLQSFPSPILVMEASSHVLTGKDPTHEGELRDTVANVKREIDEGGKDSEDDEEEVE